MTAHDLEALMRRARIASLAGPENAADRIILFPQIVAALDEVHLRGAQYRKHRRAIHEHILKVKSVIWEARHESGDFQLSDATVRKLNDAWEDLRTCLDSLEQA